MNSKLRLVLASILLLAIPSIAAGYTLQIYGNANMDGVIDEQDLVALRGMIDGTIEPTDLADANMDGILDEYDLAKVEEIIRGDPTEIHLIDSTGRVVNIKTPVKRIVPLHMRHATAVIVLGGEDAIGGVDTTVHERELLFPHLKDTPSIGSTREPDIEAIIELDPDLVITFTHLGLQDQLDEKLPPNVALVRADLSRSDYLKEEMMKLGYIIGNRDAVEDYEIWYESYIGTVEDRVSTIPVEDRVTVLMERESPDRQPSVRWAYATDTGYTDLSDVAGGVNIAQSLISYHGDVESEWVMEQNPDVIIGLSYSGGYKVDDDLPLKAYRDAIMEAPGFEFVNAVKDGRVHIISGDFSLGPQMTIGTVVVAKWLYPDLFQDMDPELIHQEFLRDLMKVDYDLSNHGAFVYPPMD
ncbi:ABC transporter substrate-binding protein [Candidatus Methanocrinis natronophilus]|uniref:ABC transporter substrate-binding protein n=1 Tax=Candidatus Methanocrinis natronophilus TaxID=3033396 RepID=A0ABT5X4S7_9EURY|nr:ABC transporter substrate-binding protein [Candidatus Methanocrinis natronophilus]MDF0589694.1 ABC transporter substrate-binding protein [Candidatus Methanocrinis natronophilus]